MQFLATFTCGVPILYGLGFHKTFYWIHPDIHTLCLALSDLFPDVSEAVDIESLLSKGGPLCCQFCSSQ